MSASSCREIIDSTDFFGILQDTAVKYAIDNVTATPEFSSDNGLGSDCANFVSKCINAGSIPIDNAGKW